ncbi:MAG TPA: CoA transferase [Candidatus Limnocylindrales bacterium]|jgi:crotonobetainyl-CoA:carnitine CoA-transferase CaiB-like acyl-CoA transferase|nr:CoA transferase [Candidatus Limnocylindrales bacterium]
MASGDAPGPLAGLLVADCSTVLAGPYCTMLLADLGADVVKVEPPDGDATRGWGPPWVGDEADGTRTAAYFLAVNRNKRSIRLDLRQEDGRRILRRLIEEADVLVENFRVGAFARLGFDDPSLEQLNQRLVHLAISGYGPDGPDAAKPGYDFVAQAVGGLMSITGAPDADSGGPTKVGVAISDLAAGLFGAVAVLGALFGRERAGASSRETGLGQRIDVSILESTLAILVNQAQNAFVTGRPPVRLGNAHPNIVPYEAFPTADGQIAVAAASERQWRRLCEALDLAGLADDPRFVTNGARVEHRGELRPLLATRFGTRPSADWLASLDAAEVPCGSINDVAAAFASPQALARGMRVRLEHPRLGRVDQVGIPFTLSGTPAAIRTPPPLPGEDADEILDELGYAPDEVERFRAAGVV